MIKTIIHTFPATPVRAAYQARAVWNGCKAFPVWVYEGRECYVVGQTRTRQRQGWKLYTSLSLCFIEDGHFEIIPAGRFNSKARPAPLT
jgi:hypothetical protein